MYFPGIGEFIPGKRFAALPERKSPESEERLCPEEGSNIVAPTGANVKKQSSVTQEKTQEKTQGEKKMENYEKNYEDEDMEKMIKEFNQILASGRIPVMPDTNPMVKIVGANVFSWRDIERRDGSDYRFRPTGGKIERELYFYAYTPGEAGAAAEFPWPMALEEARGVLHKGNRILTVASSDATYTFSGVNISLHLSCLVFEANEEFVRQGIPVRVTRLDVQNDDDDNGHVYKDGEIPYIFNEHTRCPLTGIAVDASESRLIYLGVVGHKASVDSLWSTLSSSSNHILNVVPRVSGKGYFYPVPGYQRVVAQMLEQTSYHMAAIARSAIPGQWKAEDSEIYVLAFGQPIKELFYQRLNECLRLPLLRSWTEQLWIEGIGAYLVNRLYTLGDCTDGVSIITDNDRWGELLHRLISSGKLKIEEEEK